MAEDNDGGAGGTADTGGGEGEGVPDAFTNEASAEGQGQADSDENAQIAEYERYRSAEGQVPGGASGEPKQESTEVGLPLGDKPPPPTTQDEAVVEKAPAETDNLVRTDVHSEADIHDFQSGRYDPSLLEAPPRDDQGRFGFKPDVIHAEGLAEASFNNPLVPDVESSSPSDAAAQKQGDLTRYPGVDEWANKLAHQGDRVWFGNDKPPSVTSGDDTRAERDLPTGGYSGFGSPEGDLHDGWQEFALDAVRTNQALQIKPHKGVYRGSLDCYEFTDDTMVATGVVSENTQYGDGGALQMYVPNVQQLIDNKQLRFIGTMPLTNTSASRLTWSP